MAKAQSKTSASKRATVPKPRPRPLKDKAAEVVQEVNRYTQPIQQDAQSAWKPMVGKIVVILFVAGLIYILFRQGCNSRAVDENNEKIEVSKATLDSLHKQRDSIIAVNAVLDSLAREALFEAKSAEDEANRAVNNYIGAISTTKKQFTENKKRYDETNNRIESAKSIDALDSIYREIKFSGAYKNTEFK